MAFKCRGLADVVQIKLNKEIGRTPANPRDNSGGFARTVGGIEFGRKLMKYPGEPTPEMLKADCLDIRTLKGRPWPESASDRWGTAAPPNASHYNNEGQPVKFAGPGSMAEAKRRGEWPDAEEKQLQLIAEARFRDPVATTRTIAIARGATEAQADALALRQSPSGSLEHLAEACSFIGNPKGKRGAA